MNTATKIGLTIAAGTAAYVAVALLRMRRADDVQVDPSRRLIPLDHRTTRAGAALPPEIAAGGIPQEPGWMTSGWYSYKGAAPQKAWIRVDSLPFSVGTAAARQWRYTVYAPPGWTTPLAMDQYTVPDLLERYKSLVDPAGAISAVQGRINDEVSDLVARAAADWIDRAYASNAAAIGRRT